MNRRRNSLAVVLGVVVLSAAGALSQDAPEKSSAVDGEMAPLKQCRVKFVDQVVLASDRAGTIALSPKEGQEVEKDEVIAGLRDEVPKAALAVAAHVATNDVEVRYAAAAAEVAKVEWEKAKQTNRLAKNAIPEVEVLRLKLTFDKSKLQAEQAEHEHKKAELSAKQAEAELRTFQIVAPFTGKVTRAYKFAGEAVQMGDPIVEVVDPDRLRVEGFVSVEDVRKVAVNQRVKVQLEIPGDGDKLSPDVLEGRIGFVDVSVQPVVNKVRVWAEVQNSKGILLAGQTAQMVIDTTSKPESSIKTARDK